MIIRDRLMIIVAICLMLLAIFPACEKHPEEHLEDPFIWEVSKSMLSAITGLVLNGP